MAMPEGRNTILELTHGYENGTGSSAQVQIALLAPKDAQTFIEVPITAVQPYRNLIIVMGNRKTPAHRTKDVVHAGVWNIKNAMCLDGAILKITGTRKGRNEEAGWNQRRPQMTATFFLRAHHLAPETMFRMRLTGEHGMVKQFAGISGRFYPQTLEDVMARCPGYRLPAAMAAFASPDAIEQVWNRQELSPGTPESAHAVVAVERVREDGTTVIVPERRNRRFLEEL